MSSEGEYHPALSPLSWLFGVWESIEAEMSYPTVESLNYIEVVEFKPTLEPLMEYKSETWHPVKKSKLHCESGYIRVDPESGKVAMLVAHHYGITEVSEGTVDEEELSLESKQISEMSFSTVVATVKIVRKLALKGEELCCNMSLQTGNQPLQPHLRSRFRKKK